LRGVVAGRFGRSILVEADKRFPPEFKQRDIDMLRKSFLSISLTIAAALLAMPAAHAQTKLKVGILPISESLGAVVADQKGFFKEEGLDVELTKFNSGAAAVPVLQSGRLDIAFSNTVSTLQAIEQGIDLMILAPAAVVRKDPPDTATALVTRKGDFSSIKQLEGKRIAINVVNSTAWLHVVALLERHGIDRSKVRFVEIPFPQMNDMLINNQVDAIGQVDPFRTVLMTDGKADILGWAYNETAPGTDLTQYVALRPWLEKNRDVAIRFARAVRKGAAYINSHEAEARDINVAYTGLNPALKDKVVLSQLGTEVNVDGLKHTMKMMEKYGLLKSPVDVSDRVLKMP
jgi:NitT/TauT family transport system substrate-binding protein